MVLAALVRYNVKTRWVRSAQMLANSKSPGAFSPRIHIHLHWYTHTHTHTGSRAHTTSEVLLLYEIYTYTCIAYEIYISLKVCRVCVYNDNVACPFPGVHGIRRQRTRFPLFPCIFEMGHSTAVCVRCAFAFFFLLVQFNLFYFCVFFSFLMALTFFIFFFFS